jgi:hypothetical protein
MKQLIDRFASFVFIGALTAQVGSAAAGEPPCSPLASRVWRDVSGAVSSLFAKRTAAHPDVAVIEDDGSLLEARDINLCGAARIFYKTHADDRHFLFVFAQGGDDYASGYNAYYNSVRNDVRGIGRAVEDRSAQCGSRGVLLGFANMNGHSKWTRFLFPVLDLWPLGVITHELGHQWIAFLDAPVRGMKLTTDRQSALRSHWQPLVHTEASVMYGNAWQKLPFGRFASTSLPRGFSPLDKYLMGVLPAAQVPPFFAISARSSKIWKHFAMPGNTAKGTAVPITIADIQAVYGPRVPEAGPRRYKAAFVLVVPKGQKASPEALRVVEYFRRRIPERMKDETRGLLVMDTALSNPAR